MPGAVTAHDPDFWLLKNHICSLLLGGGYKQYLKESTGEWLEGDFVLPNFRQMFEDRIKYLFMVDQN